MDYRAGDVVVVPGCGVGTIEAVEDMDLGDQAFEAYRIYLGPDAGTFWVPKHRVSVEGIRPPMDESQVQQSWKLIGKQSAPRKRRNWNQRQRRYTEMLMSNQPSEMATLIGELAAVRAKKRKDKKTLSFGERRIFDKARTLLVAEIAAATGKDRDVVQERMEDLAGKSPGS